ncbi:MAG: HD domain-containing phosphohydrolase [Terriglobia bacterium]
MRERILIVDDEAAICTLLEERLRQQGFMTRSTLSGEQALDFIAREPVDVIISDLRMPGMSGLELLDNVQAKSPHPAFLVATGVEDLRTGVEAMKKGAADYLLKPIQMDALVASIGRTLERKRLETELEQYRRDLEHLVEQKTRQLRTAMRRIELTYDETLEALGAALDLRDTETAGHSERVTRYALEIAQRMGCSPDQLKQIRRGSYLHDIGKIGIPDSILLKEGKLTPGETQRMQAHVRIGYDVVCRIAFLAGAAEIVLTHQERWDGTGYPQGLTGEEIPLGARIFAVADTLDAMTSDRPYRRALSCQEARDEIRRESGRQFDPAVVQAFLAIPEETWEEIRTAAIRRTKGIRIPDIVGTYRPEAVAPPVS